VTRWKTLLKCVVWSSALTNCLLAGFTSDQLVQYMPSFYIHDRSGFTTLEHDKGWLVVFVIFGLEHLLVLTGLVITAIIPSVPGDVSVGMERLHFEQSQRRLLRRSSVAKTRKKREKFL